MGTDGDFERIASELDGKLKSSAAPQATFEQLAPQFQDILSRRLFMEPFNQLVSHIARYHTILASMVSGQRCILRKTETSLWSLSRVEKTSHYLSFAPVPGLKGALAEQTISSRRYRVPEGFAVDQFSSETALMPLDAGASPLGSAPVLHDGIADVLDVAPIGAGGMLLSVSGAALGGFTWDFDRQSLRALSITALNGLDSGLETIVELLGAVRAPAAAPLLEKLSRHPMHFIRWKAIQAMHNIDEARGLELARAALSDPHPEVRMLAAMATDLARRLPSAA